MHEALEALRTITEYCDFDPEDLIKELALKDPENKEFALADYFGTVHVEYIRENHYKVDGSEYICCDDEDADIMLDDYLEEYLHTVEGSNSPYFDTEQWKEDASMDGRGCLACYDGEEHEVGNFFAYRVG